MVSLCTDHRYMVEVMTSPHPMCLLFFHTTQFVGFPNVTVGEALAIFPCWVSNGAHPVVQAWITEGIGKCGSIVIVHSAAYKAGLLLDLHQCGHDCR